MATIDFWPGGLNFIRTSDWATTDHTYIPTNVTITSCGTAQRDQKERGRRMRSLYEVFIVDPRLDDKSNPVLAHRFEVAESETAARLKAALSYFGAEHVDDIEDYDIIVRRIGDVRPKRKVREVKVVAE